jgi:hypothetical protein
MSVAAVTPINSDHPIRAELECGLLGDILGSGLSSRQRLRLQIVSQVPLPCFVPASLCSDSVQTMRTKGDYRHGK